MGQKGASARARRAAARHAVGLAKVAIFNDAWERGHAKGYALAEADLTSRVEEQRDANGAPAASLLWARPEFPKMKVVLQEREPSRVLRRICEGSMVGMSEATMHVATFRAVRMRQNIGPNYLPVEWFTWELDSVGPH